MSRRLESFSLPNLSLFIVKVLAGEYPKLNYTRLTPCVTDISEDMEEMVL